MPPALRQRSLREVDTARVVEVLTFALFAALSLWMVALCAWQVIRTPAVWTGTDGVFPQDQMQYLAWIKDASLHGLSSNMWVLEPQAHDYLQPAIAISAALTALGMAPWLALLLWKPVAVVSLFLGVRALIHRTVEGAHARAVALVLALLFTGWGALVAKWVGDDRFVWVAISNETSLVYWSWGYPFGLLGLAALLGALVAYARDRDLGRIRPAAPLLAALASWLHPWQGEILAVVLIGSEALWWALHRRPPLRLLLATLTAATLPLVYYVVLGRADESWRLAQEAGNRHWEIWMIAASLAPLAVPAVLAYRERPATFLAAATRIWPAAALVVFFIAQTPRASGALHAFIGIGIPLAILAVQGVQTLPWRALTAPLLVALLTLVLVVPPVVKELDLSYESVHESLNPGPRGIRTDARFIEAGDRDALHWLNADPRPGGVMARTLIGSLVPGETGRRTWVGNSYWSGGALGYFYKNGSANSLFFGPITPKVARDLVRSSGVRFLLADCGVRRDLRADLGELTPEVHRFGCARVFVVNTRGPRR